MGKPSRCFINSLAIITISIFSADLSDSQPVKYHPEANLSTTWINNNPTVITNFSDFHDSGYKMTPVLSLSNTSQFISGFYCYFKETFCFFGVIIFATRYDDDFGTLINAPQLVWSANRDHPVEVNATLKFTGDGDLMLEDADGTLVWSTKTGRDKSIRGLRFTELGNLVIFDINNTAVWQSFDHPTDSLLVGQKLVPGQKLIASTSSSDFRQGLFSLSIRYGNLFGYFGTNQPLVYFQTFIEGISNFTNSREEYVVFENGSFNGQNIPLGPTAQFMRLEPNGHFKAYDCGRAQFMRLEPDGHLKVYQWGGAEWNTVADLLTPGIGDCGYPTVCGKYGICSNGQCGCPDGSSNEMGKFKQLSYRQPNLGCSLVTPITCNFSQYHSLLELKNTSYFNLNKLVYNNMMDEKTGLEDCKNACLRNCSCKAALFAYQSFEHWPHRGCLLLSKVFSLRNIEGGYNNVSVFLKVQNSPTKQSPSPIILGSTLGVFFVVCLLVGSCILVIKRKREAEELDDEFSVDIVPGMPTRFSYDYLRTATNDFNNKLGEGGFGSVFQGTLSDGTEIAVKRLDGLSQIKKSFLAEVETIGSIHHVNLVRLSGFCSEKSHKLLVYEYMPNGSLDKWIFHQQPTLGWESRRKIIADVAKGLAYLHEECRQRIYHLDIKPQNILLDENFEAKVSDFGLAKLIDKDQSKVVATLRGTPGYMAPEWLSSIITEKVDVYSFGVVVLEILCGQKNLDRSRPEEDMHLLRLFERKGEEGQLLDMVDKHNADMQLHGAEVVGMMKVAAWCLQSDYQRRPSMSVVVQVLEGFVTVPENLDYSFINAPARRTLAAAGDDMDAIDDGTPLLASVLSGPR